MGNASIVEGHAFLTLGRATVSFLQDSFIGARAAGIPIEAAPARAHDAVTRARAAFMAMSGAFAEVNASERT
jgi:hypothetical protein